jgi:DNA-binding LacI/PurR family transcriptional regulator
VTDVASPVASAVASDPAPAVSRPAAPKVAGHIRAPKAIGIVVTDARTGLFSDPYFSSLLRGIGTALAERSLLLVLLAPLTTPELEATRSFFARKDLDGAILIGLHAHSPLPNWMRRHGIPAVLCGRPRKDVEASWIDCDNRGGATLAVEHLLSLGRRRIAIISGDLDKRSAYDRLMGYRDALAAAGISVDPTVEEVADYLPDRAQMSMERLLLNHPNLDAVFVASDRMAVAALGVLAQAGKRVPEDIAVVGFDDSRHALETTPALSTVRQPIEDIGREAVRVLMLEISDPQPSPRQVVLRTDLVVRGSTVIRPPQAGA